MAVVTDAVDIIAGTLNSVIDAIGRAESMQEASQVAAIKKLAAGEKLIDVMDDLLKQGKPIDFLAAGTVKITANLQAMARKTSGINATGNLGGNLGPINASLGATYNSSTEQETGSNLIIQIELIRASQSKGVDDLVGRLEKIAAALGLDIPQTPVVVTPPVITPH